MLGGITGKGFMPGQSGNPAGRAPGSISLTRLLTSILEEPTKNGRRSKAEALVRRVVKQAAHGNSALVKEVFERVDGKVPDRIAGADGGIPVIKVIKGVTADEL